MSVVVHVCECVEDDDGDVMHNASWARRGKGGFEEGVTGDGVRVAERVKDQWDERDVVCGENLSVVVSVLCPSSVR